MKQGLKKSRPGYYTNEIRSCIKELDNNGVFAINKVVSKLAIVKTVIPE